MFDFLLDEKIQTAFLFDWKFRVYQLNYSQGIKSISEKLLIIKDFAIRKFTRVYLNSEFKHIIIIYNFVNIAIYDYNNIIPTSSSPSAILKYR
jgi:hypothetical protein